MTPSASSSVIPSVRSFTSCSSLILPMAASWIIAASTCFALISGMELTSAWSMIMESHCTCAWQRFLPTALGWNICLELPFATDLDMICAELPSPFISTIILEVASWFPCVISFSITYSFEFASRYTLFSRTVESTPFIYAVSSVNTEFSPR